MKFRFSLLFAASIFLIVNTPIHSQEGPLNSVTITDEQISQAGSIEGFVKSVDIWNIGSSTLSKKSSIYIFSINQEFFVAGLGGTTILKFNSHGDYLGLFNSKNVDFIHSIWEASGSIFIYDSPKAMIFEFDSLGGLRDQVKVTITNASSVIGMAESIWFDMNRIDVFGSKKMPKKNLFVFDREMTSETSRVPYGFKLPVNLSFGITNFSLNHGNLYYKQPNSSSIYELVGNDAHRIYDYSFGKSWPYEEYDRKGSITYKELMEIIMNPDLISYHKAWVARKKVFSEFRKGKLIYFHFLDRYSNRQHLFLGPESNIGAYIINWFGDKLAIVVPYDKKEEFLNFLKPTEIKEKKAVQGNDEFTHSVFFLEFI